MTVPPRDRLASTARPHVLIVTDDPGLQGFLAEGLVYGGFWTSTVASALQTLEIFRLRSFDLVLVDAHLGGIGALELLRRLRGRSNRSPQAARTDVPILLVTDGHGTDNLERSIEAGADEILSAPIELEEIVPRLHQVVQDWQRAHPGRPMADMAAQAKPNS